MMLLTFESDGEFQDRIGWILLAFIVLNIVFNTAVTLRQSFKGNLKLLRTKLNAHLMKMQKWDQVKCPCQCPHCGSPQ